MHWIFLFLAGIFEIVWAVALSYSIGFTRLIPSIIVIAAGAVSFIFLSLSLKQIPLGIAYTIWTGIGAAGTVIYGMIFFNEARDVWKIFFVLMIISGIAGLRLVTKAGNI